MKIVCSWCRKEGRYDFVGEKDPVDDVRETHGICLYHRDEVQARWRASLQQGANAPLAAATSAALWHWTGLLNVTKRRRP